jgi:PAS domain S-box-containing protein
MPDQPAPNPTPAGAEDPAHGMWARLVADVLGTPTVEIHSLDGGDGARRLAGAGTGGADGLAEIAAGAIAANDLVIARDAGLRAAIPLRGSDGGAIGALCVAHPSRRDLGDDATERLRSMARLISDSVRLHRAENEMEDARVRLQAQVGELHSILDSLPAFVYYKDDQNTILKLNRTAAWSIGMPPEAIEGRSTEEFFPPEHARRYLEDDLEVIRSGVPKLGIVEPYSTPDGRRRLIQTDKIPLPGPTGRLDRLVAIATDITDQHLAEQRLTLALEAAEEGLWDWDLTTGETYFNDLWFTMLGYEPGELPMHVDTWCALAHPDDLPKAQAALELHLEGRVDRYRCEHRMRTKDGRWKWILDTGEIVERSADGEPLRMIGVHIDIDSLKRIQAELEDARVRAEDASRAKTEFLANMSHEIRTPMTAILGFLDLLADDPAFADAEDEGERFDLLRTIRLNGEHLLAIINDVLDLSKIEAGRMTTEHIETDPARIVAEVVRLMRVRAERKGLAFEARCLTPIPRRLVSDPTRLRQILLNLVGNAIKFTERGAVAVELSMAPADDGPAALVLGVRDTGIGLTPGQLDALFEAFSQADASTTRRFGGTGLGLSISARLAGMLGGGLIASSRAGEGSLFCLRLPVPTDPAPALVGPGGVVERAMRAERREPAPSPPGGSPLAGARVLLAEDGPDNQRLMTRLLEVAGASVVLAADGRAAVGAVRDADADGRPFDLVVMDMQMPELDGYDAARELRAAGVSTPVLAVTAHAMPGDRERCLDAGCDDYAAKPIERRAFIAMCARVLGRVDPAGAPG